MNLQENIYLFVPFRQILRLISIRELEPSRKIFLSLNGNSITDNSYTDYEVSNEITFQTINNSKRILYPIIKEFTTDTTNVTINDIQVWPNPTSDLLNIHILNNTARLLLNLYTNTARLVHQEYMNSDTFILDVSDFKPGLYILVVTGYNNKNILYTSKIVKK